MFPRFDTILDGFAPAFRLGDELDRLFSPRFNRAVQGVPDKRHTEPAVNVWEDDRSVYVEAELPGMQLDAVDVSLQDGQLTLKAHREYQKPEGASWLHRERETGSFARTVRLPIDVDADKVEAKLLNGVLTVKLPKAQAVLPRKIKIKG